MKIFLSKKEAIQYLNNNPLACVGWGDMSAIYWNGRIRVQKADKKINWIKVK
jgi:hypothetical protein